ncbi:MAG: hypothetical protein E7047_09295 [Lentisphaerae bacterium]|nr:hypothetical protein [Lentisphaerota bacterium]
MGLFGAPEVAALSFDWQNNRVCGVRLQARKRGSFAVVKYASGEHSDWVQAANCVLKDLSVNSSVYLLLCMNLDHSDVFECKLPEASADTMRGALQFEAPRFMMSVPEKFALQYVTSGSTDEEGLVPVRCALFPEESVHKLCDQLIALRKKPDAVINPLLTLPGELESNAAVQLDGFEKDFCWQKGIWQLAASCKECNQKLDELIAEHCTGKLMEQEDRGIYRTALTGALFGISKLFVSNSVLSGVTILPGRMRPARFRTQLRIMALLTVALLGITIFRYAGGFIEKYSSYRKLTAQVTYTKSKVQSLRKKVKAGEKELKELQRTADLKIGSRDCVGVLGYMSEKLPDNVMVHNFRWNEGTVDMSMTSASLDLDLVDFFNRLPGFTVNSANPRTHQNAISANVKLTVFDPEEELAKARRKAREKSKRNNKGKK